MIAIFGVSMPEFPGGLHQVIDHGDFLFEIRIGNDGDIADDHQFVVIRIFHDCDMAENGVGIHQADFLVQDRTHVLIRADKALHQDVAFAGVDHGHGFGSGFGTVGFMDDPETADIDIFFGTNGFDDRFVSDENAIDNTHYNRFIHGADCMRIVCIGGDKTLFRFAFQHIEHLGQFSDRFHIKITSGIGYKRFKKRASV